MHTRGSSAALQHTATADRWAHHLKAEGKARFRHVSIDQSERPAVVRAAMIKTSVQEVGVVATGIVCALASRGFAASLLFDSLAREYMNALSATLTFFFSVCVIFGRLLPRFGWKDGKPMRMINSAMVSLCHGGVAIYISACTLASQEYYLGKPNEVDHLHILAYTTAYFFTDAVFLAFYMPEEKIYIFHHVIVLLYIWSVVYYGYGTFSCMALMFFGEFTNPLHNIRHIIEEVLKTEQPPKWAIAAKKVVWPVFNLSYATFRLGISPFVIGHVVWFFATGQCKQIPYEIGCVWAAIALTVLGGSIGPGAQCVKALLGYSETCALPGSQKAGSPKAGKAL
jgi:hypothetical protein